MTGKSLCGPSFNNSITGGVRFGVGSVPLFGLWESSYTFYFYCCRSVFLSRRRRLPENTDRNDLREGKTMRLDSRRKFFYWYCSLRSNLRPGGLFVKCYPKNRKQFKFYSPSGRSFEIDAPTLNVERILSFYFRSTSKGKTIS